MLHIYQELQHHGTDGSTPTLGGVCCLQMKRGVFAAATEESNATVTAGPS